MVVILFGTIVLLLLLLILAGVIYYACRKVSRKIQYFSRAAFGTDSLMEGFRKAEEDYAVRPKSVSGATSIYLPQITRDFPDFHYEEMKHRAEALLLSYLQSVDEDNESLLTEGTSELKDKLRLRLEDLRGRGIRTRYDSPGIHRTEIFQYRKDRGRCSVIFQSAVQYHHYEETGGQVTAGSREQWEQSRYNVECIYIQDRELVENAADAGLGMNCPNCGAPISGVGAKVCKYCDTPIIEFTIRTWNFSDVSEV